MSDENEILSTQENRWADYNPPLVDLVKIVKDNINAINRNFITIGYYLRNARDRELYKQSGYANIWDFAKAEFNLSMSSASRFISINEKFSKGGNSPVLSEEYRDFSSSKLAEMINLNEQQIKQITPDMTRKEIRAVKKPKKEVAHEEKVQKKMCLHNGSVVCNLHNAAVVARSCGIECPEKCCYSCDKSRECGAVCNQATQKKVVAPAQRSLWQEYKEKHRPTPPKEEVLPEQEPIDVPYEEIDEDIPSSGKNASIESVAQITPENKAGNNCPGNMHPTGEGCTWKGGLPFDESVAVCKQCWEEYLNRLIEEDRKEPTPEEPSIQQPDLPQMKNNEQRKQFIQNYQSWPVWFENEMIGEKYFRYDIPGQNASIVVGLQKMHVVTGWDNKKQEYKISEEVKWSRPTYFLLRDNRLLHDCETNMTTIVEYLKDIQKGVKQ